MEGKSCHITKLSDPHNIRYTRVLQLLGNICWVKGQGCSAGVGLDALDEVGIGCLEFWEQLI